MNRIPDTPICERGNDLIAFLYGEIDEPARRDFERHLLRCTECELELGAFKQIRSSVVAWRQEALVGVTGDSFSTSPSVDRVSGSSKRSAMAAIRQFFELSPLWMKGSIAFASLVFCLLSVIALAHFFENPKPVVAEGEKRYSEMDLKARIEEAVQFRLQDHEALKPSPPPSITVNNNRQDKVQKRVNRHSSEAIAATPKVRRGPLTKSEREQLAADLRLIAPQDDADFDLLGDGDNR